MKGQRRIRHGAGLLAALLLFPVVADALQVRLAAYNVLFGVGAPGSAEYTAVRSILQRTGPDVIAFEELMDTDYDNWVTLAADLGYPYYAYGPSSGPLTGSQRLGFFSRYPILSAVEVTEYPGATELTRYPLRVEVQVPGALNPLAVYAVHLKASSGSVNQFRRAIEARRILSNLVAYIESNPLNTEYAIVGDFNEDVANSQAASFASLPTGLPSSYALGADVAFPVPYRLFPTDRFTAGPAALSPLAIYQEDSTLADTYSTGGQLDYLLLSQEIRESPYGAPVGEIYNSARDDGTGGLPKYGPPLASGTSGTASDHLLVFADFHLIDALPCVNPVLLVSELVDHPTPGATFIELHNSGAQALSASNYALALYFDGANPVQVPLNGTVAAGGSLVVAANATAFTSVYGSAPDLVATNLLALDGNDVVAVRNPAQLISDIYGVIGEPAGPADFSMAWSYPTSRVVRLPGISDPDPLWRTNQWALGPVAAATPGLHAACDVASVYFESVGTLPAAPLTNEVVVVTARPVPNHAASNLTLTAFWSLDGGTTQAAAMALFTPGEWRTADLAVGAGGGSVLAYWVQATFAGPGAAPVISATNQYHYPHPPVAPSEQQPRFNEVEPDDLNSDDREFVELIAPAGFNLAGYRLVHHNGASNSDSIVWSSVLPAFVMPDDGVLDVAGSPLGFCVLTTNASATVTNADLKVLPAPLQNGPGDGLILYDPASNIVDAIAWDGAGDLPVDDPGTVTTNGDPTADRFLHVLPADGNGTDQTLQAPNDVLGDPGLGWVRAGATPGALNARQTSGWIRLQVVVIGDQDGDAFADNVDNCPEVFNPIQTDLDNDGLGDACDPDRDGDGIPDGQDNCPAAANAGQADLDLDGQGDACDPDRDGDGIENDEDLCPDLVNPDQADLDGDGVGDVCDSDDDADGVPDLQDRCPRVYDPAQADMDGDGTGDLCDEDRDGDGILNGADNCPDTANPGQVDVNGNGVGDACEADADADGIPDLADNCPATSNPLQVDGDADGSGDACDPCTGVLSDTNLVQTGFATGLPGGWSIVNTGVSVVAWRFDDPVFRGNRTGGTGVFAIAESSLANRREAMDTQLRSPTVDLRGVVQATLSFRSYLNIREGRSNEVADVDLSVQGGSGPWSNLWRRVADESGVYTLDLTPWAGSSNVVIRFHYYNAYQELYWQVDEVTVSCVRCTAPLDTDGDGVGDPGDNCPQGYNPDQADLDRDGMGDVCDPDRDGDGLPDAWEWVYFGSATAAQSAVDSDLDGLSNLDEYYSDTVPTNGQSRLQVQVYLLSARPEIMVQNSSTARLYHVYGGPTLDSPSAWPPVAGAQTGNGSAVTFILTNQEPVFFYRAGVRPR